MASNLALWFEEHETAVEDKVAGDTVPHMREMSAQLGESPV